MTHKTTLVCFLIAILFLVGTGCAAPNSYDQHPLPATETPSLPAESPTPEIEYTSPKFFSIPDQIFLPGEDSLTIDLAEYVYNADPASDLVSWHADSGPALTADFNGPVIEITRTSPPSHEITSIQVEACHPGEKCGSKEIEIKMVGKIENGIFHTQNDGIIIDSDGTRIMIDTLFSNPWGINIPKILQAMQEAAPPYDQADLILITHQHADHFDAALTLQNMVHNPEAVLISTDLVVELLAEEEGFDQIEDRVIGLQPEAGMHEIVSAAGVEIEVFYLSHGDLTEVPNFAYLFRLDGITYFHTGDVVLDDEPLSTFTDYGLPERKIDYAFVPYFMLTRENYFPYAAEGIAPEFLVPVHISAGDKQSPALFETMEGNFDNLLSFREDFSWHPLGLQ